MAFPLSISRPCVWPSQNDLMVRDIRLCKFQIFGSPITGSLNLLFFLKKANWEDGIRTFWSLDIMISETLRRCFMLHMIGKCMH